MIDSVLKGTGNSRFLKSVSNFLTLYPTYEAFVAALVAGTLPIDLNGINDAGWTQVGTPLNKTNLLSDEVATKLGIQDSATPSSALDALFTFASNGKALCAEAVTGMGVETPSTATFEQIAQSISQIETGPDTSQLTATPSRVLEGYKFVGSSGEVEAGTIPLLSSQTYYPSKTIQYIESGQYIYADQTIRGCDFSQIMVEGVAQSTANRFALRIYFETFYTMPTDESELGQLLVYCNIDGQDPVVIEHTASGKWYAWPAWGTDFTPSTDDEISVSWSRSTSSRWVQVVLNDGGSVLSIGKNTAPSIVSAMYIPAELL